MVVLTSTVGGPTALPHECKPEVAAYKNYQGVAVSYTLCDRLYLLILSTVLLLLLL